MTTPSSERLIELSRELIASWYDKRYRTDVVPRSAKRSAAEYPMIHGLVAHTHRSAAAALLLTEHGMAAEAVPLVRITYECAITATWISQLDDAIEAIGIQDLRERQALRRTAEEAGLNLGDTWESSRDADIEALETSSRAGAKYFEQRCRDLHPVGAGGYLLYRVLSAYSHPTTMCAEQYLDREKSTEQAPVHGFAPQREDSSLELQLLVGSLVWAGRAIEYKEEGMPERRNQLRRAAREAGVVAEPQISDAARVRLAQQKRDRKRRARVTQHT